MSNQKTPTTILLTPERKFHSFGYAARDFYHDLDPNEAKQWLYLEKFKMKLHTTGVSEKFMSVYLDFRNISDHTTLLWNTQHFLMPTWAGRCSEDLTTCLPWHLTRVDAAGAQAQGAEDSCHARRPPLYLLVVERLGDPGGGAQGLGVFGEGVRVVTVN